MKRKEDANERSAQLGRVRSLAALAKKTHRYCEERGLMPRKGERRSMGGEGEEGEIGGREEGEGRRSARRPQNALQERPRDGTDGLRKTVYPPMKARKLW